MGNSVHKRQLFHWIGWHLENDDNLSLPEVRHQYIDCLKNSFEDGIRLSKSKQEKEAMIGSHEPIETRFMACFTDNRLSQCAEHASNYGKLGLGFSKQFILKHGGLPVNYVRHTSSNNRYADNMYAIYNHLKKCDDEELLERMEYVMSFMKPISKRVIRARKKTAKKKRAVTKVVKRSKGPARLFGTALKYLWENEWRIVYDEFFHRADDSIFSDMETFRLKYEISKDLYTIVFPDRMTMNMALDDDELRERILSSPVTNCYALDEIEEL